jgi:predicted ATPase
MNTSSVLIGIITIASVLAYTAWIILGPRLAKRNIKRTINALWQLVETEQKLSLKVTEAGEVFEKAMELLGHSGEIDQKIASIAEKISNVRDLRQANALRMNLLANTASRPSDAELLRAVEAFKTALIDLGM